jgi:hypothetical protein
VNSIDSLSPLLQRYSLGGKDLAEPGPSKEELQIIKNAGISKKQYQEDP